MNISGHSIFFLLAVIAVAVVLILSEHSLGNRIEYEKRSDDCDSSLWQHVWGSERLKVYDICKTVSGVIEDSKADADGDQHMLLRLDKGYEKFINKRNVKKSNGCLVIEAICVNNITKTKAVKPCEGYVNNVTLPSIGDPVTVTGSYVKDLHKRWMEIHPITKLTIIN